MQTLLDGYPVYSVFGLDRHLVYSVFGLDRYSVYSGFGLDRYPFTQVLKPSNIYFSSNLENISTIAKLNNTSKELED